MKTNTNDASKHPSVDAAAASAHDAIDWAAETTNKATDSIGNRGQEIKAMQEKWLVKARDYVQDNPATSVGIALAGGYLLSSLLRSR